MKHLLIFLTFFSVLFHVNAQDKINRETKYCFVSECVDPAFDISPNQTRMASCYRDNSGTYHLFVDYLGLDDNPYNAEIRYYRSADLYHWQYISTVAQRGELGIPDARGCSSPFILATDKKIYLFYGGTPASIGGDQNISASRGEVGYTSRPIILATAAADQNGAPLGNFKKKSVILVPGNIGDWDAMRLDDPCVVLKKDSLFIFYKGFNSNKNLDKVKVGLAKASLNEMKFKKNKTPVLSVLGGGEMPRVFMFDNIYHMFYRHFRSSGYKWQHYISTNGKVWKLIDPFFFNGFPGGGPPDIMMIYGMNGKLLKNPKFLVAGSQNGINKLWIYNLLEKKSNRGLN